MSRINGLFGLLRKPSEPPPAQPAKPRTFAPPTVVTCNFADGGMTFLKGTSK